MAVVTLGVSADGWAAAGVCSGPKADRPAACDDDGGGGDGTMPATVTFRDAVGDRVMSDCGTGDCPYIDDIDKVSTAVGHEGSFYLSLTKTKKPAIRPLRFDFSECVGGPCDPPPCIGNCTALTGKISGSGENLSTMPFPDGTGVEALFIVVNFGDENERVFFLQFDSLNTFDVEPSCPSADADVRRIDLNTWEIEGQTACLVRPGGARDPAAVRGMYNMPFKMTVTTN
jgi:hypothetical protein